MSDLGRLQFARRRQQDHWVETGNIVASANVLAGTVTLGVVGVSSMSTNNRLLMLAMLVASGIAVIVAYYGIQVGVPSIGGRLSLRAVILSFALASCQIAMFAVIGGLAKGDKFAEQHESTAFGLWVLLAGLFALFGGGVNYLARCNRVWASGEADEIWRKVADDADAYDAAQFRERVGAAVTGSCMLAMWTIHLFGQQRWLIWFAVCFYVAALLMALKEQRAAGLALWNIQSSLDDPGTASQAAA